MGARTDCGATTSKNGMVLASEVRRIRLRLRNTSQRRTNRLRFQNRGKPRTAGLCGREAAATGHLSLSCTIIERAGSPRNRAKSYENRSVEGPFQGTPIFTDRLFSALQGTNSVGAQGSCPISKIAHSGSRGQTGCVYDEGGVSTLSLCRVRLKRCVAGVKRGDWGLFVRYISRGVSSRVSPTSRTTHRRRR